MYYGVLQPVDVISDFVNSLLTPAFKSHKITKDQYKAISRKVVKKVRTSPATLGDGDLMFELRKTCFPLALLELLLRDTLITIARLR